MKDISLFLDSGAFSAFTKGVHIDIQEYIGFIKENERYIDVYANLDVIGDAEATLKNQRIMEDAGLNPLPCFHYGDDIFYLHTYLQEHDYIALGGMVPISTNDLAHWLDNLFSNFLCDKKGNPIVKVHGFGLTSLKLLRRYPWYSVDSTSWVMASRMGTIYIPQRKSGKWIYDKDPWKVAISSQSPKKSDAGMHFETFSDAQQKEILLYLDEKGYRLGKSEFRMESAKYKLKEGERWGGKESNGKRLVETIVEKGACNHYKDRDEINTIYYIDLEKSFPEWPYKFKSKRNCFGFC